MVEEDGLCRHDEPIEHCLPCSRGRTIAALRAELDAARSALETERQYRRIDDERVEDLIQKLKQADRDRLRLREAVNGALVDMRKYGSITGESLRRLKDAVGENGR